MRPRNPGLRIIAVGMFFVAASGLCRADLQEGALAYQRGDLPAVIKELRPLADEGNALAQYLLGVALANANPPLQDVAGGEMWLRKSAAQGNVAAMRDTGQLNIFAKSPPNRVEAEKWLLAAADRGDFQAQHLLGVFYLDAKGADRRPADAYKWLLLASQRGHLLSGVMLSTPPGQFSEQERKAGERMAADWKPVR